MPLEAQDNPFPSVLFRETVDPANPSAGDQRLFVDTDHLLKLRDSAGTVTTYPTSAGLTDPMTTRGDVIVRNASNVTARLAIGTTGKVLSSDGTDISWQTPSSGFSDPMTTRGDVIVRNASNVTARLAIGSSGKVLQSDGTDISWQTPGAGTFSGCALYNSTTQNVSNGAQDVISFDTELYDTDAYHAGGSPTRLTVPATAKYRVTANLSHNSGGTAQAQTAVTIRLNGSTQVRGGQAQVPHSNAFGGQCCVSVTLDLTAADYLEVLFYNATGSTRAVGSASGGPNQAYFEIVKE